MKKFSILLALVFVLASCGKTVEEVSQSAAPIKEAVETAVDESVVADAKEAMLKEAEVMVKEELMVKDEEVMIKDETAMIEEEVLEEVEVMIKEETVEEAQVFAAGTYQEYSETTVAGVTGNTVLFFHATWCPPCKAADKILNEEELPEGLNILKVDYDSNVELRQKYGVTSQHTFVLVDENMEKIKSMVGARNSADIVDGLLK